MLFFLEPVWALCSIMFALWIQFAPVSSICPVECCVWSRGFLFLNFVLSKVWQFCFHYWGNYFQIYTTEWNLPKKFQFFFVTTVLKFSKRRKTLVWRSLATLSSWGHNESLCPISIHSWDVFAILSTDFKMLTLRLLF